MSAVNEDAISGHEGGFKHREALDMIPMCVADKQVQRAFSPSKRAFHQFQTQLVQAGTGIQDKNVAISANFDAGSVSSHRTAQQRG